MQLVTLNGAPGCSPCGSQELGKFSFPKIKLKLKSPRFPKFKFKAPKFEFKAPKIKLKIKGPNFGKMAKGLMSPFEQLGSSLTGMGTGLMDSFTGAASGLVDQVGQTGAGLVDQVGQAAGEMAPELLKAGANLLAPGAGSLLDMVPGISSMLGRDQQSPEAQQLQQMSRDFQMQPQQFSPAQQAADEGARATQSDLMKYAPIALGGAALLFIIMQSKGKR